MTQMFADAFSVQLSNMELTKQQGNVMAALKQGNDALKQAQQEVRTQCSSSSSDNVAASGRLSSSSRTAEHGWYSAVLQ
jgi:hypothetical protein